MQENKLLLAVLAMIEVKARLLRGSVFFAGECIECEIIFTNTASIKESNCSETSNHALNNECMKENSGTDLRSKGYTAYSRKAANVVILLSYDNWPLIHRCKVKLV